MLIELLVEYCCASREINSRVSLFSTLFSLFRRQSQVELEECRRSTAALRQEVTVCANEWSQEIDVMKAKALQHVSVCA